MSEANSPVRTCIGCRTRADRHTLLRLVVSATEDGPAGPAIVEPDVHARRPGRGAWIHPRTECLDLAERRRAIGRAFRLTGPFDVEVVRHHLEQVGVEGAQGGSQQHTQ